jgi:sulfopyruvate decarboxylase subunit alpha
VGQVGQVGRVGQVGQVGQVRQVRREGQLASSIDPQHFLDALEARGFDFFTGVPCSLFAGVTRILDGEPHYGYVGAVREDSAIGIAAGAYLGGRQPVVLMQNSGLGVSINALVSLNRIYDIPALLVVTWRGRGGADAPEHVVMGAIMEDCLRLLQIPYRVLAPETIDADLDELTHTMIATRQPVALVVGKGLLE